MNYSEALHFLRSTLQYGSRPGLGSISVLLRALGDPQDRLPVIHVAGTNGKGSTCKLLASVLQCAGYKTGLFLSPYLAEYRDSLLVGGEMIGPEDFAGVISRVAEKAGEVGRDGEHPTEFEVLTAAAYLWFYESGCDAAVVETGMGGQLDATNAIKKPVLSVITSISYDHTAYLGETLAAIAAEKCGIIKPDGITLTAPYQPTDALNVIRKSAKDMCNRLLEPDLNAFSAGKSGLDGTDFCYRGLQLHVLMPGRHQVANALTAAEAAFALREYARFNISDADVLCGLKNAQLAARQEVLCEKPLVMLDGAHNTEGVEALAESIREYLMERRIIAVMGMLKDKPYEACIALVASLCGRFIAVAPQSSRALSAEAAAKIACRYCGDVLVCGDYEEALHTAVSAAGEDGAVVICGSLYLAGPMRSIVKENCL